MRKRTLRRLLVAVCAFALAALSPRVLPAQSQPTTHNLTLSNLAQSIDKTGRVVVTAQVTGDLPGTFTLALAMDGNGHVTGGEWALNVSYIELGPPASDGDGDPSESLVQRGVVKGSVSGGSAVLTSNGLLSDVVGAALNVTGATLQFAGSTSGSGTVNSSDMTDGNASSGSLTVTF